MRSLRTSFVVVTTTVDSRGMAARLARCMVDRRLAACVQFMPVRSVYRWKGKLESADEHLLLAKTRRSIASRLVAFIREEHSYELPEITVMPITGWLPAYLRWIEDGTAAGALAGRRGRANRSRVK